MPKGHDLPEVNASDRDQADYTRHNEETRCGCTVCRTFRQERPRVAATIDGGIELGHRVYQYRVMKDYS